MPDEKTVETNGAAESAVGDKGGSANGSILPGWTAGLSKEQKEAITSQKLQLPEKMTEFWDGHSQLEARLKNAVIVPGKDAPKEEWDNYRKATGVPLSPGEYAFEKPQLPQGMVYDQQQEEWFRAQAHSLGLSKDAASKLYKEFNTLQVQRFGALSEQQKKAQSDAKVIRDRELVEVQAAKRLKWGEQYDVKMPKIVATLQNVNHVPANLLVKLDRLGLVRDPDFLDLIDRYAMAVSPDRKLGIRGEEGEGVEEENKTPPGKLPGGFFKETAKRYPARKRAV